MSIHVWRGVWNAVKKRIISLSWYISGPWPRDWNPCSMAHRVKEKTPNEGQEVLVKMSNFSFNKCFCFYSVRPPSHYSWRALAHLRLLKYCRSLRWVWSVECPSGTGGSLSGEVSIQRDEWAAKVSSFTLGADCSRHEVQFSTLTEF